MTGIPKDIEDVLPQVDSSMPIVKISELVDKVIVVYSSGVVSGNFGLQTLLTFHYDGQSELNRLYSSNKVIQSKVALLERLNAYPVRCKVVVVKGENDYYDLVSAKVQ